MEVDATIDDALFRLALHFVDASHGLDDPMTELEKKFERHLAASGESDKEYAVHIHLIADYIRQLAYPSHLSVDILLRHGYLDRAVAAANALANPLEKRRARRSLADYFLKKHMFDEALRHAQELDEEGKFAWYQRLADACVDEGLGALLLSLARRQEPQVCFAIYKDAALAWARRGQVEESLQAMDFLRDHPAYASVQSAVAHALAAHGHVSEAQEVARKIDDPAEREDAH